MNLYEVWQRRTVGIVKTQRISISGTEYIPASGSAIIAPNHLNWKDIFFLSALIPRQIHYVATYELFDTKRCYEYCVDYMMQKVGRWLKVPSEFLGRNIAGIVSHRVRALGAVPVNRQGSAKEMFQSIESSLKNGQFVCLFPEGGTGFVGRLKKFKKGISKIVYDLWQEGYGRIPVLPAAIEGTDKFYMPRRPLSLRIGSPLYIEDHIEVSPRQTLIRFTEQLWQAVYDLLFEKLPESE
jgi:1-acyl-sn-glycerol-3-phosphate acyltransferase